MYVQAWIDSATAEEVYELRSLMSPNKPAVGSQVRALLETKLFEDDRLKIAKNSEEFRFQFDRRGIKSSITNDVCVFLDPSRKESERYQRVRRKIILPRSSLYENNVDGRKRITKKVTVCTKLLIKCLTVPLHGTAASNSSHQSESSGDANESLRRTVLYLHRKFN